MSDELNSQLSAYVDDELAPEESGLLVRRLCRDETLRQTAARYTLIGDSVRGDEAVTAPADFAGRVMMAVDGQAAPAVPVEPARSGNTAGRQWGMAIAASVMLAVVALMTLPGREQAPVQPQTLASVPAGLPGAEVVVADTRDFTVVPATTLPQDGDVAPTSFDVPMVIPAGRHSPANRARLNNYLVQHLSTTGSSRQGLVRYRNVGFVTQSEREQ